MISCNQGWLSSPYFCNLPPLNQRKCIGGAGTTLHKSIDPKAFKGYPGDIYRAWQSPNFLERAKAEAIWFDEHLALGLDPHQSFIKGKVSRLCERAVRKGLPKTGINFGSQDYLSLSTHPLLAEAAQIAIADYGVHSAGSAALAGISDASLALEAELAAFTGYADATVFPIGWAAGYGVITSLIRPDDHVILDLLAHNCLQEGARAATLNVHRARHLSVRSVEQKLQKIRNADLNAGILVVTETLFSMDSDTPDIGALQDICHSYGATLFVDIAHDLGALGPSGRGVLEIQGMVGKVDIIMGAFSKCFASIGGFVASNEPALKIRLRTGSGPSAFTNAMTPIQVGIIRKSLEIIQSAEGDTRRARLRKNIQLMRKRLTEEGFEVLGQPSPIIPVILGGSQISRLMTKFSNENGGFVNLVEYPAVPRTAGRWRIQMMADHTSDDIEAFISIAVNARVQAKMTAADNDDRAKHEQSCP